MAKDRDYRRVEQAPSLGNGVKMSPARFEVDPSHEQAIRDDERARLLREQVNAEQARIRQKRATESAVSGAIARYEEKKRRRAARVAANKANAAADVAEKARKESEERLDADIIVGRMYGLLRTDPRRNREVYEGLVQSLQEPIKKGSFNTDLEHLKVKAQPRKKWWQFGKK